MLANERIGACVSCMPCMPAAGESGSHQVTMGHDVTWVREMPVESVVGTQQNTASPKASSGWMGRRCATGASRGVISRMERKPYSADFQSDMACIDSPRFSPSPEIVKMPKVVAVCSCMLEACTPKGG